MATDRAVAHYSQMAAMADAACETSLDMATALQDISEIAAAAIGDTNGRLLALQKIHSLAREASKRAALRVFR